MPDGFADRSQVAWDIVRNRKLGESVRRKAADWYKTYGTGGNPDAVIDKDLGVDSRSEQPKAQPAVPKTAAEFEQELTSRVVSRVQSMYDTGNWSELGFMGYLETETDKAFGDLIVEVVESDQLEGEVRDFINSFKAPEFAKAIKAKLDEGKPASDKPSEQPETKPTERNMTVS